MDCLTTTAATAGVKTVKRGDTHPVRWQIPGFNLTGCSVRVLVKRSSTDPADELAATIVAPATDGIIEHVLTGELAVGDYMLEIEITETASGQITTAPTENYGKLRVVADLG